MLLKYELDLAHMSAFIQEQSQVESVKLRTPKLEMNQLAQ